MIRRGAGLVTGIGAFFGQFLTVKSDLFAFYGKSAAFQIFR